MTFPDSGRLSRGEAAIADPTTEFCGHEPAWKVARRQVLPRRFALATRSFEGTATSALSRPASSRSCWIDVTTVVGTRSAPPPVWPGPPACAMNEGEKSSAPQFVVVSWPTRWLCCPCKAPP